jgi:hypothetical protein
MRDARLGAKERRQDGSGQVIYVIYNILRYSVVLVFLAFSAYRKITCSFA